MSSWRSVVGALGIWAALLGGVLLAIGDAVGNGDLSAPGVALFAGGVLWFFGAAVWRSRRTGSTFGSSPVGSAKDSLRLAWVVIKGM